MTNIEERLTAIRTSMLDESIDSDKIGLAIHYLRDKFEQGYKYGGAAWIPIKKGKTVTGWNLRLTIWRTDETGTLEQIQRNL